MLNAVYPQALDCGISADAFWNMSMAEIEETMDSYHRTRMQTEKIKIERLFVLAEAICTRVAYLFASKEDKAKVSVVQPWDMYPYLFSEEKLIAEEQKEEQELCEYLEARKRHAIAFNKKRQEAENEC